MIYIPSKLEIKGTLISLKISKISKISKTLYKLMKHYKHFI